MASPIQINNYDPRIGQRQALALHGAAVTRDYIAEPRLGTTTKTFNHYSPIFLFLPLRL